MMRRVPICLLIVLLLLAAEASAQDFDVQHFAPAVGPHGSLATEGARTVGHLKPTFGILANYSSRPIVVIEEDADGDETEVPIVDQQLALHAMAGIGLFDRLQFDLDLPVYLVNEGDIPDAFNRTDAGDLRLRAKGRLLGEQTGFGLALATDVTVPTGNDEFYVGASGPTVAPRVVADFVTERWFIALNLGALFREDTRFGANVDIDDAATFGLGAEYEVMRGVLRITGDVYGRTSLAQTFEAAETPVEAMLGAKLITTGGFAITGAAGGGIAPGVGAPEFRMLFGVAWAPRDDDFDGDGILNRDDACPEEPEDLDGFEDEDGCVDPDNDNDAIADDDDQCPNEPEDADGFQDDDGCPDLDNDADGIPDDDDECSDEPEDVDGFQDEDGCPDPDNDDDGILDSDDQCPDEAEDVDEFQDEDGCPDPDNDGDGIPDTEDKCPDEAGIPEDDGCPPAETKAVREKERIKILDKVFFETGKALIKNESHDLLNQVALVLRTNPDVTRVEIAGHTDHRGSEEDNQKLSQSRAEAVRDYLINRGIEQERLTAVGYGEAKPLVEKRTKEAMAQNRRVEFTILEQEGTEPPPRQDGETSETGETPETEDAPEQTEEADETPKKTEDTTEEPEEDPS
jgi:outer membrane protein OmpA-like peptidoglycan-associated protein